MKQEGLKRAFVREMQQKIFSGELQIGQQLPPERELAVLYGVSRSLINTGILELEKQGFVRIIPRQGSIVADYKRNGTLDVLVALTGCEAKLVDYPLFCNMVDMRVLVECECARLASIQATLEELDMLGALVHCMRVCANPLDAAEPLVTFHYRVTQISGNAVYAMTFKSFEPMVKNLVRQHLTAAPDLPKTAKLHGDLLAAMYARDMERSAQCMRVCLLQGMSAMKKLYKL